MPSSLPPFRRARAPYGMNRWILRAAAAGIFFKQSSMGFPSQSGMTFFEKYTAGTIYLFLEDIIFVVVLHEGECS